MAEKIPSDSEIWQKKHYKDDVAQKITYDSLAAGKIKEVVWWVPETGTDLLIGIRKLAKERKIRAGYITAIVGSLSRARFHAFHELPPEIRHISRPSEEMWLKGESWPKRLYGLVDIEGAIEMNGQGVIGETEGEVYVHVHATFSIAPKCYVGHLDTGTIVYSHGQLSPISHFSVVIHVLEGVKVSHLKGSIHVTKV